MNLLDVSIVVICVGCVFLIAGAIGTSYFRNEEAFLNASVKVVMAGLGTILLGTLIGGFA